MDITNYEEYFTINFDESKIVITLKQKALVCIGYYVKSGEWESYWELSELIERPVSKDSPNCEYLNSGERFEVYASEVYELVKDKSDIWIEDIGISVTPKRDFIFLIRIKMKGDKFRNYTIFHEDLTK